MTDTYTIRRLTSDDEADLGQLFETIKSDPASRWFGPHPFSADAAKAIANYADRDIYVGAWIDGRLRAYGMLRGWDQGFAVPSLGLYVDAGLRGMGVSSAMVEVMHKMARDAGAEKVRLRVAPDNHRSRGLFEKCGYRFDGTIERGEFVGVRMTV